MSVTFDQSRVNEILHQAERDASAWLPCPDLDDFTWEFGPDPEDDAWWMEESNRVADDYDVIDEPAACVCPTCRPAAGPDRLGLISPGLAEQLARASIVGHADHILHEGSDPRLCACYGCVERRTRHHADDRS